MVILSKESLSKLKKQELINYVLELTNNLKKHLNSDPTHELVLNPQSKIKIDDKYIGNEIDIQVTVTNSDKTKSTHKVSVKIIDDHQIKLKSQNMSQIVNVDNYLALMINKEGLTFEIASYVIMKRVYLGNEFCFKKFK